MLSLFAAKKTGMTRSTFILLCMCILEPCMAFAQVTRRELVRPSRNEVPSRYYKRALAKQPRMSLQILAPLSYTAVSRLRTRTSAAAVAYEPLISDRWATLALTASAGVVGVALLSALVPKLGAVLALYNGALVTHPFATKAAGTGITYVLSDLTAQAFEGSREPAAARLGRACRFGAIGALWVGPLLAAWFQVMDWAVPGAGAASVAAKVLLDQCIQGPFMISSMFVLAALSAGESRRDAVGKARRMLKPTWVKSVYVWSPVQAVQQTLVPLEYRVAVANFVSYFWDTYLAHEMCGPEGCKVEDAPELAPAAAPAPLGFGERRPLAWCEASDEFAR